ncbi:YpoC family protein [Niallia sp. 01092]|uniref:YpoC family protein n=1 Tax=unclassified Niallia TaxID=2837522 RepID=UPI003FD0D245
MGKAFTLTLPSFLRYDNLDVPTEYLLHNISILETFQLNVPFIHEAAFFQQIKTFKPWEKQNIELCVTETIKQWQTLKEEIGISIKNEHKQETRIKMIQGIGYFLQSLYWTNELPVSFESGLISQEISIKPINVGERLTFILSRLNGYHSFKQLEALFMELEKQFAIKKIKRKS